MKKQPEQKPFFTTEDPPRRACSTKDTEEDLGLISGIKMIGVQWAFTREAAPATIMSVRLGGDRAGTFLNALPYSR